ncbi:MAG: hypothetical protein RIQ79_165 [Verrucomicrobiota bacterium]
MVYTLLEAFDRLEVLEATAEALQLACPFGTAGVDARQRAGRAAKSVWDGVSEAQVTVLSEKVMQLHYLLLCR